MSASEKEIRELLDFATTLAHEAGDITLKYFGGVVASAPRDQNVDQAWLSEVMTWPTTTGFS